MQESFGQYIQGKRAELRLGLREFCEAAGVDPSNYSKYERGILAPPEGVALKRIAKGLRIHATMKDPEWRKLTALAAAGRGEIPSDLVRNQRLMSLMPALYQHLREHELPAGTDPIEVLVKALRKEV